MTRDEWASLSSFRNVKMANGSPVDPTKFAFSTMSYLNVLQRRFASPIQLIRGNHGPDGSAVDWCCPGVPYQWVAMEALALPCAIGLYSGLSVHTDTRQTNTWSRPARWLAVHEEEEEQLGELKRLIYRRDQGWAYLVWSDHGAGSFQALQIVVNLSEAKRQRGLAASGEAGDA
jgi:hypothetical protein